MQLIWNKGITYSILAIIQNIFQIKLTLFKRFKNNCIIRYAFKGTFKYLIEDTTQFMTDSGIDAFHQMLSFIP